MNTKNFKTYHNDGRMNNNGYQDFKYNHDDLIISWLVSIHIPDSPHIIDGFDIINIMLSS